MTELLAIEISKMDPVHPVARSLRKSTSQKHHDLSKNGFSIWFDLCTVSKNGRICKVVLDLSESLNITKSLNVRVFQKHKKSTYSKKHENVWIFER